MSKRSKNSSIFQAARHLGPTGHFGRAVGVSADQRAIAVGAPFDSENGDLDSGAVYVFRRGDGPWAQVSKFFPEGGQNQLFG